MGFRAAFSIGLIASLAVGPPGDLVDRQTLAELARVAGRYEQDARRFTCTETVRWAGYRGYDRPFRETLKTYDYLLIRAKDGRGLREHIVVV